MSAAEVGTVVATVEEEPEVVAVAQPAPVDVNALMMAALERGEGEGIAAALEKLVELEERVAARNAKTDFARAFAAFRKSLPAIPRDKPGAVRDGSRIMYASLETIQSIVDPLLERHGFYYSFTTEPSKDGQWLIVECLLEHEAGHSRSSSMPVPMTSIPKASKAQEATGTRTYGKRIALSDVLGIQTTDDLDGAGPGEPEKITDEQVATLTEYLDHEKVDAAAFLKYVGVEKIEDLLASDYDSALRDLKRKVGR